MRIRNKKLYLIITVLMVLVVAAGCAAPQNGPDLGFATNDIEYEIISDNMLDDETKDIIEQIKHIKGYRVIKEEGGYYYVFIGMGQMPTGGYSIKVKNAQDIEGLTKILIEETVPGKDDMVTEALTYPYVIIKINKDLFINVIIEKDEREKYEMIDEKDCYNTEGYSIFGVIKDITIEKGYYTFFIEASADGYSYDKAFVKADLNTKVYIEGVLAEFLDLNEGMEAGVIFSGPVAESYPVQAYASCISDKKPDDLVTDKETAVYEIITEEEESLQYIKHHRGFGIIREDEYFYYIFIGAGEKNTGGYDIFVIDAIKTTDAVYITVQETSPGKDDMVIQVITYPHQIIRINKSLGRDIIVISDSGELFEDINDETKEDDK